MTEDIKELYKRLNGVALVLKEFKKRIEELEELIGGGGPSSTADDPFREFRLRIEALEKRTEILETAPSQELEALTKGYRTLPPPLPKKE